MKNSFSEYKRFRVVSSRLACLAAIGFLSVGVSGTLLNASEISNDMLEADATAMQSNVEGDSDTVTYEGANQGNDNNSAIGVGTYINGSKKQVSELKTIQDLETNGDSTDSGVKYNSVTDTGIDLVDASIGNTSVSESIMIDPKKTTDEIAANLTWSSNFDDTHSSDAATAKSTEKYLPYGEDTGWMEVKDYGYYYNLDTMEYAPVDLKVTIDYVDFWSKPKDTPTGTDAGSNYLTLGMSSSGIEFETFHTDEVEFSFEFTNSETGEEVNVPVIYKQKDQDISLGIGFKKDDLYELTTYYADSGSDSYTQPAWVDEEFNNYSTDEDVFNYEPYFDWISKQGLSESRFEALTMYNIDGDENYSDVKDRGYNRLKFKDSGDFITIFDSWGTNSNGYTNAIDKHNPTMITNGKDSTSVAIVNSNTTMTLNMNNQYFNYDKERSGKTQTNFFKPYSFDGETLVRKSAIDENKDGVAEVGETINYEIRVINPDPYNAMSDVPVRDSLLEDLPDYLTYNNDMKVDGSEYTGDLTKGDLVLTSVPAKSATTITYSVTLNANPEDVFEVDNVVTDDGSDPDGLCDSATTTTDCDGTETPIEANTIVEKDINDASGDGYAQIGETLSYTLQIKNEEKNSAYNVAVKDSILGDLPTYVTWDGDFEVDGSTYTGNPGDGDLVLDEVKPGETVTITYDIVLVSAPTDSALIDNIVTDTGAEPLICSSANSLIDCDNADIPFDPETIVEKSSVESENEEGQEVFTYTLTTTNEDELATSQDVIIRDSLLENMPEYLELTESPIITDGDGNILPEDAYSGDLSEGTFTVNELAPGESVIVVYSVTRVGDMPEDEAFIKNVVTDNGGDPDGLCDSTTSTDDCAATENEIFTEPTVSKSVINLSKEVNSEVSSEIDDEDLSDEDSEVSSEVTEVSSEIDSEMNSEVDSEVEAPVEDEDPYTLIETKVGDVLEYSIDIVNDDPTLRAVDVPVHDTLLEDTPAYLELGDIVISATDEDGNEVDVKYTGDLTKGDFVIEEIMPGVTVNITYDMTITDELPTDSNEIINTVCDNKEGDDEDCASTETELFGETLIEKAVVDYNTSGLVDANEMLNYTITVTNPNESLRAITVPVRDSLLEDMPLYLSLGTDIKVTGVDSEGNEIDITTTGDLTEGTFNIDVMNPGDVVTIEYGLIASDAVDSTVVEMITNTVTDTGTDPELCEDTDAGIDCDTAEISVADPEENIINVTNVINETINNETNEINQMPETGL